MEATAVIVPIIILAAAVFLLHGKSSRGARLYANALIGATAGPLATLAGLLLLAAITGATLPWHSPDCIAVTMLQFGLFTMGLIGAFIGGIVGALGRGVRAVTFWSLARVFLGGFVGMVLGGVLGSFIQAVLLSFPLAVAGLYVGMSVSTTRSPDSDQATWWPKPPTGRATDPGTGASRADTGGDAKRR
ncbi:MAG: hypothetical protein FJ290_15325 [Planctomycetes bacterium]|nr:hypothetical protein [Planctomycetota bacterium]